ncbi:MAG: class II fructose-bisphosphate aldolase family protein [Holosporales bacterium]|jgi:fructose-bisphosphate aldolase class II|nr:class II fructose-bisphosphate aldolase family protein [Holosporales bacterium]
MFINKKLIPGGELLNQAVSQNTAVGAFNFANMEVLQGIVLAANGIKTSVILQTSTSAVKYMGFGYLKSIVSAAAEESNVPLALHLDHGQDFAICKRCIDEGFSSVMIDASSSSFKENVEKTKAVVDYAKKFGVSVEAELGTLAGVEDDVSIPGNKAVYTDPDEALKFIELTGIDSLAVAIGTSHGPNKGRVGNPKLSIETLKKIKEKVGSFPLVLHGASSVYPDAVEKCNAYGAKLENAFGITDVDIQESVKNGIAKINVDTDLRIAFLGTLRQSLEENQSSIDIRKHLGAARDSVKEAAIRKIKTFSGFHSDTQ